MANCIRGLPKADDNAYGSTHTKYSGRNDAKYNKSVHCRCARVEITNTSGDFNAR